jgi:hypothetical protein
VPHDRNVAQFWLPDDDKRAYRYNLGIEDLGGQFTGRQLKVND